MSTVAITQETIDWVKFNMERNCTPESMIETLIGTGFDYPTAHKVVHQQHFLRDALIARFDISRFEHEGHRIDVLARLTNPMVLVLDNVMSPEECDQLVAMSENNLVTSGTVNSETGGTDIHAARTSKSSYHGPTTELVQKLDRRFSAFMRTPESHGENIQVVQYVPGGEYKAHFDFFPGDTKGGKIPLLNGGQRISTLIIYLNDVEEGGTTSFPDAQLSVVPRKGSGVYFHYMRSDGTLDPLTLHSGDPVLAGTKWIATKWMHQRPRT
jgi:prolyl 4-hydroxylase